VLVEHYVSRETTSSMAGNVYLGRVQNVLPSMEAAFVDIGKGRNAVLYAGEVNWDAAGLEGNQAKRIENALKSGRHRARPGHQGPDRAQGRAPDLADLACPGATSSTCPRVDDGHLPQAARHRAGPPQGHPQGGRARTSAGVIVRTAAEGASEEELRADVERLTKAWDKIKAKAESAGAKKAAVAAAPALLHGEPDLTVGSSATSSTRTSPRSSSPGTSLVRGQRVRRGRRPDLARGSAAVDLRGDVFAEHRIDEQIAKAMDRKVWLPSGGSLVIDRTEAMTVVDVNTGKFVGAGGNLEETVTKNNIEAAEEIVRQLRLRDIGGIIVIDFIDMVLESNRDLVVRRLLECLGRDRTKHQVAEVTSLGLVQMTRKRVGSGLVEVFSRRASTAPGAASSCTPSRSTGPARTTSAGPTQRRRDRVAAVGGPRLPVVRRTAGRMPWRRSRRSAPRRVPRPPRSPLRRTRPRCGAPRPRPPRRCRLTASPPRQRRKWPRLLWPSLRRMPSRSSRSSRSSRPGGRRHQRGR
jgi:ribonuclease E